METDCQYAQGSNGERQEKDIFFSHRVRPEFGTESDEVWDSVFVVDHDKLGMKQTYLVVLSFQVERHSDITLQMENVSLNFCKPIQPWVGKVICHNNNTEHKETVHMLPREGSVISLLIEMMDANIWHEVRLDVLYCDSTIADIDACDWGFIDVALVVVYGSGKRENNGESAVKSIMVSYSCKAGKSAIWITPCVVVTR